MTRRHHETIDLKHTDQAGFTIVELMIATVIFSVILLIITSGIISFTTKYYKGIVSSNTQNVANSVMDTITQAIKFSGDNVTFGAAPNTNVFCVGSKQFTYNPGMQLEANSDITNTAVQANWALYETTGNGNCTATTPTEDSTGRELLSPHMRIAYLSVCGVGASPCTSGTGAWQVTLRIAYGDIDLLCSQSATPSGSCGPSAPALTTGTQVFRQDVLCKGNDGSQFCDIAGLTTVAQKRIETGS